VTSNQTLPPILEAPINPLFTDSRFLGWRAELVTRWAAVGALDLMFWHS